MGMMNYRIFYQFMSIQIDEESSYYIILLSRFYLYFQYQLCFPSLIHYIHSHKLVSTVLNLTLLWIPSVVFTTLCFYFLPSIFIFYLTRLGLTTMQLVFKGHSWSHFCAERWIWKNILTIPVGAKGFPFRARRCSNLLCSKPVRLITSTSTKRKLLLW